MPVVKLPPNGRDLAEERPRSPARQRLAEALARTADLNTRIARLREPTAVHAAAAAELPAAMGAHARAAQEADLSRGARSQSQADQALDAARARVQSLRRIIAETPNHSAEINALAAEGAALGMAAKSAHRAALREAIDALTVEYHQHARRALIATAALDGLRRYCAHQLDEPTMAVQAGDAVLPSRNPAEGALFHDRIRKTLADYSAEVQAWCGAIQGNPDAYTEDMAAVAARLPHRPEETEGNHDHAA